MAHIIKIQTKVNGVSNYVLGTSGTYTKLSPNAMDPVRENEEYLDVGYTLSAVERCDGKAEDEIGRVNWFTTQLSLTAPPYFYWELIPHPSLDNTGYTFSNAPKVIYDGVEIKIPLIKNGAEGTDDLALPYNVAIAVLRESQNCDIKPTNQNQTMGRNNQNGMMMANRTNQNQNQNRNNNAFDPTPAPPVRRGRGRGGRGGNSQNFDM